MILDDIVGATARRVAAAKEKIPLEVLKEQAKAMPTEMDFPFEAALKKPDIAFICEVKRASPSKGVIVEDFPFLEIAKSYEEAGADCISVLTEPDFFKGENSYLSAIRAHVKIPLLRKDFTIDEYQIYEAKTIGADAVLLICELLDEQTVREYIKICDALGLSALVEVHDAHQTETAIKAGARIIGVNNRNLKDFTVDIGNSLRFRRLVPDGVSFVAESGIKTAEDINALRAANINAVLIGETLMKSADKRETLNRLRGI